MKHWLRMPAFWWATIASTVLVTSAAVSNAGAQDVVRGEAVFANNCAVCHGTMASGRMGPPLNMIPPEIASLPPAAVAAELTGLIRNGIPGAMPRFLPEQVSDEDMPHLVAYLFSVNGTLPSPSLYEALEPITADMAAGRTFYPETGHSVGGEFRSFFLANGGVPIFGLPLSEEYWGVSPQTGAMLRMQLFERTRMELHPEASADQRVQLGLLGTEEMELRTHFLQSESGDASP